MDLAGWVIRWFLPSQEFLPSHLLPYGGGNLGARPGDRDRVSARAGCAHSGTRMATPMEVIWHGRIQGFRAVFRFVPSNIEPVFDIV